MMTPRLWHPDRRGTLIVGDPRFGTHFLQRIVADRVSPYRSVQSNAEIDTGPIVGWPKSISTKLEHMIQQTSYQVAIVNSVSAKTEILAHEDMLESWHTIRLTRQDKIGWFRSWALFFLNRASEGNAYSSDLPMQDKIWHHGTPQESYIHNLGKYGPINLDEQIVKDIVGNLCLHELSKLISVDEEIDYDHLPGLQSEHTWWKGNQYPEIAMDALFTNWAEIQNVLTSWTKRERSGNLRQA